MKSGVNVLTLGALMSNIVLLPFQRGEFRRQNLTYKVYPRTERVKQM